jgi:hypothetical protein
VFHTTPGKLTLIGPYFWDCLEKLPPFQDRCEQKRNVTAHFVAALSGREMLLVENWAKAFVWFFIRRQGNFHCSARPSTIVAKLTAFESSFKAKEKR